MVILRTDRLVLRRLTVADVDGLVALDSDPEVMRFLTKSRQPLREWIERQLLPGLLAEYDRSPGFGVWAAEEAGVFAGWFGLRVREGRPAGDVELGYRLRRAVWGRGLATEGSRALLGYAFGLPGVERVWAETMAVNTRSRRVLAKAGLRLVRTFHKEFDEPVEGTEFGEVEYAVTRADYSATGVATG